MTSALVFPVGNLAPDGAVIKATAIDPSVVDADNVYRHSGPARVFASEHDAIRAIKSKGDDAVRAGDVVVLAGCGPAGTGMEETYQLTSALKYLPWGKHVPVLTDARFSGVSRMVSADSGHSRRRSMTRSTSVRNLAPRCCPPWSYHWIASSSSRTASG